MTQHFPAIQVVLPLVSAPLCLLLRNVRLVHTFAVGVAWGCLFVSGSLLKEVLTSGVIKYELGGWAAPWGIEYRVDIANAYVLVIVSTIAAVVLPFGRGARDVTRVRGQEYLFYSAFLLCLTGLLGITITGDAFNVFVFLEISSLSAYTLVAMGQGRRALIAAYAYLVLGTIGGTFLLIGIGFMYEMTGTLNMEDLTARLPPVMGTRTIMVSFAFIVIGTSIKLAVFPLHQWLPNAYTYAPGMVSAFLSATATKVSYYVLVRVLFTLFGVAFVFDTLHLHYLLVPFSLAAMFVGSLAAIHQDDIKRLLAYSSVAQIGYMTLGLSTGTVAGLTGGLVHLFNHALMKGGLFLVVACVGFKVGCNRIDSYAGLGRRMPLTMAAFVVGGLSLIGVPATVGFVSKWYLIAAVLEQGWYLVAFLVLLSSLLAVVYVWRIVEIAYLKPPPERREIQEAPLSMLLPTWALIGATIYFGFATDLTVGVARAAAEQLFGHGP